MGIDIHARALDVSYSESEIDPELESNLVK